MISHAEMLMIFIYVSQEERRARFQNRDEILFRGSDSFLPPFYIFGSEQCEAGLWFYGFGV